MSRLKGRPWVALWAAIGRARKGASLRLATVIAKSTKAVAPAPSAAVTRTLKAPTSALDGVPLKVALVVLKFSQAGSAAPEVSVAVWLRLSPMSASLKVSAGSMKLKAASWLAFASATARAATGASLTALTVTLARALALLKAVLPPLTLASAVAPALPEEASQARRVRPLLTVPFQSALGTKRTALSASASSRRAALSLGAPKGVQLLPPSVLNCQLPWLLSTAVTATPGAAPLSTSATQPATRSAIRVPGLPSASSVIAPRSFRPDNRGASLTGLTLKPMRRAVASVSLALAAVPPSSCTWKLKFA